MSMTDYAGRPIQVGHKLFIKPYETRLYEVKTIFKVNGVAHAAIYDPLTGERRLFTQAELHEHKYVRVRNPAWVPQS